MSEENEENEGNKLFSTDFINYRNKRLKENDISENNLNPGSTTIGKMFSTNNNLLSTNNNLQTTSMPNQMKSDILTNSFIKQNSYNNNLERSAMELNLKENIKEKEKEKNYNKNSVMKEFLESNEGIDLLNKAGKLKVKSKLNLEAKIDSLIDFYSTWGSNFPIRKNARATKYDFLKEIEVYCTNHEVDSQQKKKMKKHEENENYQMDNLLTDNKFEDIDMGSTFGMDSEDIKENSINKQKHEKNIVGDSEIGFDVDLNDMDIF